MTVNDDAVALFIQVEEKMKDVNENIMDPLIQARKALDGIIERDGVRPNDRGTGTKVSSARCKKIVESQTALLSSIL